LDIDVLVLDSGLHQRDAFDQFLPGSRKPMVDIEPCDIFNYDVVIIPFKMDQQWLQKMRGHFEQFMNDCGVLIILGATDHTNNGWIPGCCWNEKFPTVPVTTAVQGTEYQMIFDQLNEDQVVFHTMYSGHGHLELKHENLKSLATGPEGEILMAAGRWDSGGRLLVTTLDPDHHATKMASGPTNAAKAESQENAKKLLENIINWSKSVACRNNRWRRLLRVYFKRTRRLLVPLTLLVIPGLLTWFLYISRIMSEGQEIDFAQFFAYLAGSASLVGLIEIAVSRFAGSKKPS